MDLASAVAQTLAYSAYFHYPLSPAEAHFWLITPQSVSSRRLKPYLQPLSPQATQIRQTRQYYSEEKTAFARRFIDSVRWLPGIELIALTGSVAVGNAQQHDDIDLLIVTQPYYLWLLRPVFIFLLGRHYSRRHPGDDPQKVGDNAFCPNLWLETSSLSLPLSKRNLYTAHEVLQIKPLYDPHGTYLRFLRANRWASRYLANAYHRLNISRLSSNPLPLPSFLLAPFAGFSFLLQLLYMMPKHTSETVTFHTAFFHKKSFLPDLTRFLDHQTTFHSSRSKKTL